MMRGCFLPIAAVVVIISAVGYFWMFDTSLEERNKNIVRQTHDEIWSKGNMALINELYSADYVGHWADGSETHGLDTLKETIKKSRTDVPDLTEKIEIIIAQGNWVVTYFHSSGTFSGIIGGIPYNNKKLSVKEMAIYKLIGGKIAEQWTVANNLLVMEQLGIELKLR